MVIVGRDRRIPPFEHPKTYKAGSAIPPYKYTNVIGYDPSRTERRGRRETTNCRIALNTLFSEFQLSLPALHSPAWWEEGGISLSASLGA